MQLSALIWAVSALTWNTHGAQAHPTAAPARRDGIDWGSIRCPAANSLRDTANTYIQHREGHVSRMHGAGHQRGARGSLPRSPRLPGVPSVEQLYPRRRAATRGRQDPDDVYVGLVTRFTTTGIIPLLNTTSVEIVTVMKGSLDDDGNNRENRYLMAAWRYDDELHGTASRSEHPSILVDRGNGTTLYTSYETYFTGPGTLLLLPFKDTLQKQYTQQGLDLKAYVEKAT
ncbi:hypothetical protein PG994_013875 [Apiospora phragmitis]|uniref:Uncharacterized protein n=1 Tax=Apiospora phragmitis TaxID=2905665 RepID=A0ABR1T2R1_9PEZI